MRTIVTAIICVLCIFYSVLIQSTICSRSIHREELNKCMTTSMSQTMRRMMDQREGMPMEEKYAQAAFLENLLTQVNSQADISVRFYKVDCLEGLLDVEVTARYTHLNKKQEEVRIRRTIIYEKADS